jgi:tetratricopeptide (TPR) repeat protein
MTERPGAKRDDAASDTDEVDGLLESLTLDNYREPQPTIPHDVEELVAATRPPPPPAPEAPRLRVPRPQGSRVPVPAPQPARAPSAPPPASRMPSIPASKATRPGLQDPVTSKPPSVNPAGPARREPFPPAMSPAPGATRPLPRPAAPRKFQGPTGFDDSEIDAALMPLSAPPPAPSVPPEPLSKATTAPPPPPNPTVVPPPDVAPESWHPPDLGGLESESLDELRAVELSDSSPEVLPGETPGTPQTQRYSEPGPNRHEVPTFDGEGDALVETRAIAEDFDEWDDDAITSVLVPDEAKASAANAEDLGPEASVEYTSASLDELGVGADHEAPGDLVELGAERSEAPEAPREFGQQRPAAAHLGDHRMTEAWVARAEWFEAEAPNTTDAAAKARLFLAASELWAMAGNVSRARESARRASQAAPAMSLASRQARWLAAMEGDDKAVATALDLESRAAPSDAARVHAAYLAAEVQRLLLKDAQNAERRFDQLARQSPTDPRPHLMKLALELATSASPPKMRWPDAPELEPLANAAKVLLALRGAVARSGRRSPAVAFEDARRAVANGDRGEAAAALSELSDVPGIGDSALLVAAAFDAPSPETRDRAIATLGTLLGREPSPFVRRALAARALEQGDSAAMSRALDEPNDGEPTFGPADRVALGALAGADAGALGKAAAELVDDETLRPLSSAATSAADPSASLPVGDPVARASVALGRRLSTVAAPEELKDAVHALRAAAPDAPLGRMLSLELDAATGATSAVAAEITRLLPADQQADGKLAAALIEEAAGHADIARRHYTGAVGVPAVAEAAVRALLQPGSAAGGDLLATLASMLGEETTPRQALLLFEAAVRSGLEDPASAEDLLTRSHEAAPDLPFAARLASDLARTRGDFPKLIAWLGRRREAAKDPTVRALDLVREALLTADDDVTSAAAKAHEALAVRPNDIALRELAERLDPTPSIDRGRFREHAAEAARDPRSKAALYFEAMTEYERESAVEDAARAARAARATSESALAAVAALRLAPEGPEPPLGGLPKTRALEHDAFSDGRDDAVESIAAELARLPDRGEATAHARLAVRLRSKRDTWESTKELVDSAAAHSPRSLWTLRQLSAHARVAGEDERLLEADRELASRVLRPLESGTLSLRAAEAADRLGRKEEALALVDKALEAAPEHLVARSLRARLHEELGNAGAAAEDQEALARACRVPEHAWDAWYRAGVLFADRVGNGDRALAAFEKAASIDVVRGDVFDRLQLVYVERGDRAKLAALLEERLAKTVDPEERVALEVTRGRALADIGDREAARKALGAALEANPEHADALEAYAGLAAADGDFKSAEESWIRLARAVPDPEKQAAIYGKLAELYGTSLPNPERAEICYREILKRKPDDLPAMEGLVRAYARLGDLARAVELATKLLERASTPEEKRDRTLALALVHDEGKDKKGAFSVLDKARKTWPHDSAVLRALADHHLRHGETAALNVLLDRASAEARRALSHGRFDLSFFGILAAAAEARGQTDAFHVIKATLAALEGRDEEPPAGAGAAAGDAALDDLLAPELLSPALRALLRKLPGVLDTAYPMDLKALRAAPLPANAAELGAEIRSLAEALGVRSLEVFVSPALGSVVVPASSKPARLVMGQSLLDGGDDRVRRFLLLRALKMMQTESAALTRIAPIELWPATAALLSLVAKGFEPQGVDATKLADAKRRISAALPPRVDEELATLAFEIGGSIGNRASQLGQAVAQWASRTALLAVGSPAVALRGVALALGTEGPPADQAERLKWVLRQPEAKDLAVFGVSDAYAELRRRLGLA